MELANRLLRGEPETTIGLVYNSTDDGRNAANRPGHEVSHARGPAADGRPRRPRAPVKRVAAGDRAEADLSEEELGVTVPREVRTAR